METGRIRLLFLCGFQLGRKKGQSYALLACFQCCACRHFCQAPFCIYLYITYHKTGWLSILPCAAVESRRRAARQAGPASLPRLVDARDNPDRRTSFFSQHRQKQPWQKTADKDFFFRGLKICLHEQFFLSGHLFTAKSVLNAAKFALKRTLLPGKIVFRSFGSEILFLKSDWARQREKKLVRCFREGKISAFSRKKARKKARKTARKNGANQAGLQEKRPPTIFIWTSREINSILVSEATPRKQRRASNAAQAAPRKRIRKHRYWKAQTLEDADIKRRRS